MLRFQPGVEWQDATPHIFAAPPGHLMADEGPKLSKQDEALRELDELFGAAKKKLKKVSQDLGDKVKDPEEPKPEPPDPPISR